METPTTAIALLRTLETTDGALDVLSELGAEALQPLVDVVLDGSESKRVREIAAQAVGRIVPEGVQRLLAFLNSAEGDIADLAAWGLRFNHAGAIDAAARVVLDDSDETVRDLAKELLYRLSTAPRSANYTELRR